MTVIHHVIEPAAAKVIKQAIDIGFPIWRNVGVDGAEIPVAIAVEIGGKKFVIVSGAVVIGAGHLGQANRWQHGEYGVVVKHTTCDELLDSIGQPRTPGFIHFHRSSLRNPMVFGGEDPDSPLYHVRQFFFQHDGEYSAFVPTTFARFERWRALPLLDEILRDSDDK